MSFFYADIKTDELKVHGHTNSIPGQIEILDAASSNMVILKAPNVLAGNVTLILPAENGGTNSILTTTDGSGTLGFVTASGDLTLGSSGAFTVNGISNTSTIQSTANIVLAGTNSLYFADSNVGLRAPDNGNLVINAASNVILEKGSSQIVFDIGATNSYINFSNVVGDLGYGIKSSNGIMQYKNTADAGWSNIGSGGGGGSSTLAGLTDVALSGLANNNILVYDINDSKWHNEAITSGYYGAFSDTTTQTNNVAASYNVMLLNTTDESYGVSVVNNSQITVAHSGVYNIQFSAQLDKTDSGTDFVNIWLVKNGVAVPNTDTSVSLTDNNAKAVAAWNFVLSLAANDYVELAWKSADPDLRLYAQAAGSPNPAIPSVIATVTQQAFVLGGTSNFFAELLDVNTAGKTGNSLVQYNVATSKWDAVSNLTLNNGNYIKLGNTGNIVGSNGGNVTINGGNVDVIVSGEAHVHNNLRVTGNIFGPPNGGNLTINSGNVDIVVSGEAHVHNNLRVTGNIFLDGNNLSNISAPVGGNLNISASNVNILSTTETKLTGPVRLANTLYFDGGYLANITSPSAGNLVINSGNLDIIPTGYLNIQGNTLIAGSNILAFGDQSTYINSNATGNLDIRATAGNVNITANHDIVLTTNSASTIRLVGPNSSSLATFGEDGSSNPLISLGGANNIITYDGTDFTIKQDYSSNIVLESGIQETTTSLTYLDPYFSNFLSNSAIGGNVLTFTSNTGTINTYAYKKAAGTQWTTNPPVSANSNTTLTFDQYFYNNANTTISLGARTIKYNQTVYSSLQVFRDGFITFGTGDIWNINRINFFSSSQLQSAYPTSNTYYGFASINSTNDALTITYQDVAYSYYVGYDANTYSSIYSNTGNIYTQIVLYCDNSPKYGTYDIHYGTMVGNVSLGLYSGSFNIGMKSLNNYTTTSFELATAPTDFATTTTFADSYNLSGLLNPAIAYTNTSTQNSIVYTFTSNVGEASKFAFKKANGTNWTFTAPYTPTSETSIPSLFTPFNIDLGASGKSISFNQSARSNLWINQSGYITFDSAYSTTNTISFFNGITLQVSVGTTISYGYTTFTNANDALLITFKDLKYGSFPYFGSLNLQIVLYCNNSPLSGTYELNYGYLFTDTANSYTYTIGCASNSTTTSVLAGSVETNFARYPYYNTVFKKGDNELNLVMDISQNMNYINMTSAKGPYGLGFRSNGTMLQYSNNTNGVWNNFVGGSNAQVLFNDNNVSNGFGGFTFNKANGALAVPGDLNVSNINTGINNTISTGNVYVNNTAVVGSNVYAQNGFVVGNQYSYNPPMLNSSGLFNVSNIGTGMMTISGSGNLALRDSTTVINSGETGNLDIRATDGNVNITANHDVVITTNSASTIRLVGPNGSSPVNISFAGSCSYINFGSITGDTGAGIKYDGTNVAVGSGGSWSGISNTTLNIAGRTVALGGSNTVGFSDLTGTVVNSQLANSVITVGTNTLALGSTYTGLDLTNSTGYQTANLVGTITNSQLANSTVTVAGKSVTLGSSTTMDLNDLNDVVVSGSILANSVITYDSGDSLWKNRKLYIGDLSGISITGTPATSNVLISDGTNFINRRPLYSDISGNADTITFNSGGLIAFNGSRVRIGNSSTSTGTQSANAIAIGNLAGGSVGQGESAIAIGTMAGNSGVAQPANSLVINSSGITLNASGTSRTHIAPIRQDQSQTSAVMMYNTETKEVVYNDRVKDYLLLTFNGNLSGNFPANTIKNPYINNTTVWATPPVTTTFSNNNIAFSNSTGSFVLPSLTRLYKVSFKLAVFVQVTQNDTVPQTFVQLISGPSSNIVVNRLGILVQDTTVSTITDCYISGVSNIYVAFGNEIATTTFGDDIQDGLFTVDITEV